MKLWQMAQCSKCGATSCMFCQSQILTEILTSWPHFTVPVYPNPYFSNDNLITESKATNKLDYFRRVCERDERSYEVWMDLECTETDEWVCGCEVWMALDCTAAATPSPSGTTEPLSATVRPSTSFLSRALDTTSSLMKSLDIVTGRLSFPPLWTSRGRVVICDVRVTWPGAPALPSFTTSCFILFSDVIVSSGLRRRRRFRPHPVWLLDRK